MLQTKGFIITGFAEETEQSKEKGIYAAHVSSDFAGEILEDQQRLYRVYFRLAGAQGKITDVLEQESCTRQSLPGTQAFESAFLSLQSPEGVHTPALYQA